MGQVGSMMRLFVGEFLLITTSDATIQHQSIKTVFSGTLGLNHPILPTTPRPQSDSLSLVLFMSVHATTGHPNAQGWNLGVNVDSSLSLHPHTHQHTAFLHFSLFPLPHLSPNCPIL